MILSKLYVSLCEFLTGRRTEMGKCFLHVRFAVNQTITPNKAKSIVAFLVTIVRTAFEPHFR